ncbi:HAMP domain-containing protein [Nocardioides alcanivorans]|uniref:HAMP domain-containing protein n=1 Tax=Nocardioides alcanivorans TaxID=2897352 RepID=UPI001F3BE270|nr:HAMP domain-containing protein [Nocardioides alcanivorans]
MARNGLRPVRRLTAKAEEIARTDRLTPITVEGTDEVARLSSAFNTMLQSLDASRSRQRQLIADASHELRTLSPPSAPTSTCSSRPMPPAASPTRRGASCSRTCARRSTR